MDTDRAVARRAEAAFASGNARAVRGLRRTFDDPAYEALGIAGGWFMTTPVDVPLFGAKGLGFEGPVGDDVISEIEHRSQQRGLPARFDHCDLGDATLGERLAARGYTQTPSCQVWVRAAGPAALPPSPPDIDVALVDPADDASVLRFAEVVARGYRDGGPAEPWNVAVGRNAIQSSGRHAFRVRVAGALAGGGLLGMNDGLATCSFMSTLPGFRRRGIQRALMGARLALANALGADVIAVQCTPGSSTARNAERLGFRAVYTRTFHTK